MEDVIRIRMGEACKRLAVCPKTLRNNFMKTGKISYYKHDDGKVFFDLQEIEKYVQSRKYQYK